MDGTTWEQRMADRAALRAQAAALQRKRLEAAEQAALAAEFPAVPGEHEYIETEGPHRGHREHMHGGVVICSCGEFRGIACYIPDWSAPEPELCPVCTARGIPVDGH